MSDVDRSAIAAASASAAGSPAPSASSVNESGTIAPATVGDTREAPNAPIAPEDRPAASGHRFGPDLACSECGMHWEAHQREPAPCATEEADDAFFDDTQETTRSD